MGGGEISLSSIFVSGLRVLEDAFVRKGGSDGDFCRAGSLKGSAFTGN